MENNIWKQNYSHITISVKFLGIYWEFWSENYMFVFSQSEFVDKVKEKYRKKFGKRSFKITFHYPLCTYTVQ